MARIAPITRESTGKIIIGLLLGIVMIVPVNPIKTKNIPANKDNRFLESFLIYNLINPNLKTIAFRILSFY